MTLSSVETRPAVRTAGDGLREQAAKPRAEVFVACPFSVQRGNPEYVDRVIERLRVYTGDARIVPPGSHSILPLAFRHPAAVLVVIVRPDLSLGEMSTRELGTFKSQRRPVYVVVPGRGLVDGRRLRLRAPPPEERTASTYTYVEAVT